LGLFGRLFGRLVGKGYSSKSEIEDRIRQLEEQKQELEQKLADSEQHVESLEEQNRGLEEAHRKLNEEYIQLEKRIKAVSEAAEAQVKRKIETAEKTKESYEQRIQEILSRAEEEKKELGERNKRLEQEIKRLIEEREREAYISKEEHRRKIGKIVNKLALIESKLEAAATKNKKLTGRLAELEQYNSQLSENYSKIEQVLREIGKRNELYELVEDSEITATVFEETESGYKAISQNGIIYIRTCARINIGEDVAVCITEMTHADALLIHNPDYEPKVGDVVEDFKFENEGNSVIGRCKGNKIVIVDIGKNVIEYNGPLEIYKEDKGIFYAKPADTKK